MYETYTYYTHAYSEIVYKYIYNIDGERERESAGDRRIALIVILRH